MELKTKHKRLLSLILAIIFVLEPFSSSVALAMEGGALNEELVHSEASNKKDSTTFIVPGQDELGNKTNELAPSILPGSQETTTITTIIEENKTTILPGKEKETSIVPGEEKAPSILPGEEKAPSILPGQEDPTKILPGQENQLPENEIDPNNIEGNQIITEEGTTLPINPNMPVNIKPGKPVSWHIGDLPQTKYLAGEQLNLSNLTLITYDANQIEQILTYRDIEADKTIDIKYDSVVLQPKEDGSAHIVTISKAGLEDLSFQVYVDDLGEYAGVNVDTMLYTSDYTFEPRLKTTLGDFKLDLVDNFEMSRLLEERMTSTASFMKQGESSTAFMSEYKMTYKVELAPSLKARDYFTVKLSDYVLPTARVSDIKLKDGRTIAKANYDYGTNTIVYSFTEEVTKLEGPVIATVSENISLDQRLSGQNGDIEILNVVAGVVRPTSVTLSSNLEDNRLVIQKINKNGTPLEGAKFGLYNSKEELIREDITDSFGRIDFGKLEKGLYSLKELEAPKGYLLPEESYIVAVKEDGTTTWNKYGKTIEGKDLSERLLIEAYNLENNNEIVKLKADLRLQDGIREGDYFTLFLDKKLQDPDLENILSDKGLTLAEGKYDQATNTIKYVFTKVAENQEDLSFQLSVEELKMDTLEVLEGEDFEFINIIGSQVQEPVLLDYSEEIKIEEGLESNFLNISSQITGIDWENHTVEYTVSLNPNKNPINKRTSLEISNDSTSVLLNPLDTSIEIFRQDELTGQLVNITREFNTNNYTADESILKSFALDFDENLLNGSSIQIKVTSRFVENKIEETTKVGLRTNLSTMDGLDSVQSADYREKKIEAQVLSEIVIPVVNFEEDVNAQGNVQGNSTIIVENLDENNKPIVGAKYQISDAKTKQALWIKTSDERGIAQFVELDPGEYILEEIFTPEGYNSAGYFINIKVDENKNTTYTAVKIEADKVVELEAEEYEAELEKEKSQVRQEVQIEKKKQEKIMEKLEVNLGDILSEIMKPSPELPDFSKELDIFNINKENLIEIEEPDHKENGKLVNSLLTAIVEGLLGKPQVARAIEAELPKEETVIEENTTEPATEETETTVEDADTKLEPQTEPVEETTTEEASTELEISQPTYISMFSASALVASPMGLTTPTATTNVYDTRTDPSATTVGTNYGVYSVDVKDFHYRQNLNSREMAANITSNMDISIRIPKDVTGGNTFTLSLPPDFTISSPLNGDEPIGRIYKKGDRTTSLIDVFYKTPDGVEPELLDLNHYLEFKVTDAGAKIINDSGFDYDGTFTLGGEVRTASKDGVWYTTPEGYPDRNNFYTTVSTGLFPVMNRWASPVPTNTSITKTFSFTSSYNGQAATLNDQSTLLYGNKNLEGSPSGTEYLILYSLEGFNKNIDQFTYLTYYSGGEKYAKFGYTLNGGDRSRTYTTTFTDNTGGTMTSRLYKATNGDPNTGSFIGPYTEIYTNETNIKVNGTLLNTRTFDGLVNTVETRSTPTNPAPVVFVEQKVTISPNNKNTLITAEMSTNPTTTKYRADVDVYFEAEITPSPVANFVKVVKADRNGDGVLEEYGVTSSPATFRLLDEAGNVIKDNLQTDSKGLLTVTVPKAGVNYILEETSVPTGFKDNPRSITFFVRETDNTLVYLDSSNNWVETSEKGYAPVENELENPHNTLTINKKDQEGNPLPGAEFAIINKDTGITVYRTSGQDGKVTLLAAEFPDGHYIIRETKAPNGYDKSTEEKEFWVANGGLYYNTNPSSTASSINNIETANLNYNIEANKTGDSFFGGIVNKLFSSFNTSIAYAEAEVDLPYEEATKNYNVGITYPIQQGGEGAQTIRTHAPILTEAINPIFNQTFYVNPDGVAPTTSNSNSVFTIFGKELNSLGQPTSTPSATLLKDSEVRIYKLTSGTLPENPKDFNPAGGTYTVQDVTSSVINKYVANNDTYQINFDGAFNTSPYPTYIVVLDGKAENNNTKVYSSASVINTAGNVEPFPVITFPNSGAAVSSSADRGWGSINLNKYNTLGVPLSGGEFKIVNNLTGEEAPFALVSSNGEPGRVDYNYYLENGIRPGSYTIVETKAPVDSGGPEYKLAENLEDRSWKLIVDDTDLDGLFEYVLSSTNGLASNDGDDPRNIRIENIPSYRPLDLKLNLYTQDGSTPLSGGSFTIQKVGGNSEPFTVSGDNLHTVTLEEPGEYIIRQTGIPEDYTNAEGSWKVNVVTNNKTGNLEIDVRQPYNYLKEVIVGSVTSKDTLHVLNKKEATRPLELPPPYGEIPTATNEDISFDVTNTRNFKFTIEKTDTEDSAKKLSGAEFKLTKGDNTIIKTATTDVFGRLTFDNLEPGDYIIQETKAPAGYKLNDQRSVITIDQDGSVTWTEGGLISSSPTQATRTETVTEYITPYATPTEYKVGDTRWPSYMNTKSYIRVNPEKGTVEFYLMLKPDANVGDGSTDKDTRLNLFGDNISFTADNVEMFDVEPGNRNIVSGYMDNKLGSQYTLGKIAFTNGVNQHNYPITKYSGISDPYLNRSVNTQITIPEERFGGTTGWSFLVKVTGQVTDPNRASSINFAWLTGDDTAGQTNIQHNTEIKALLTTKEIEVPVLNYNPTLEVKNEKEPEKDFSFNKVDEKGQGLSGATFKLSLESDPNTFFEAVSTAEGKVAFSKIPLGTYILEETKVPGGYEKTSDTWRVVVSETGVSYYKKVVTETTETTVTWEPVDTSTTGGNLTVTNKPNKVDFIKVDGDNKALSGVVFELRQKIGETYSSLTPKVTATSDANGYFSFENIYPGDYGVFEITPPEGYPTPIAEVAHITVNDDGSISEIHSKIDEASKRYKVVNIKGTAEFSFKKIDESGNSLVGVEFALSGYSAQNGTPARFTATSGTDGIISFTELPLDSYYYLRETKTVQGYSIANNLWIVRIIKATTTDTAEIQQKGYKVELHNTGSLTPAGSYGPHPTIDGAWAKMNADKTKYVNVKTGAEQELDAVSGATIKPQDLNDYGSWPDLKVATQPLEITNKKADLLVYKHDENGEPLDGAEFTLTLTDGTGASIVKSSINGEVAYTDLADGTYELTETKAPLGYDGTKDKWIVTVSNGEITVKKDGVDTGTDGTTPVVGSPIEYFDGNGIIDTTYSKSYPDYYTDLNIGTKIISADREKGTFEALVYVNNINAKAHRNSNILIEGINPETSLGSSVKTLSSAEIYKVSNNYISTAMPSDFNIDLSQSYYTKVASLTSNTDNDISINLEGSTAYYNAYIVKITGTYDKTSTSPISLKSTFNGYVYWNGYYYDSTAFVYNYVSPSPWSPSDPDSPTEPTTDNSIGIGPDGQPTVTVTNTKRDPKGKVKIYKTGSDGKPLENVMFELKGPVIDGDSNPPTKKLLTEANGEYLFENLQEGEYFLTELQTIEGYLKTTQIWKIIVDKDGITKILSGDSSNVTVENTTPTTPTDSNITFPKYEGTLNGKTQVSSPSATQEQTYYPSYPNPIVYTSEIDGEYAADFDQTAESLRNPWLTSSLGNYGGYLTYQGNYQTTFNKDWHTMDFAKVAKYAEKTSPAVDDHNYDITLKVTGNTYPEKETDKLGVIILYDNSNSMNRLVGSTGKTRTTLAKEATTNFVNTLSRQNPDTEFALVTYGSSVFDGKTHTTNYQGYQYTVTTPNASYLGFTSSPTNITTRLPSITPNQYSGNFYYFGGTFTGGAFLEAQKLVEQAKARTTNKFDRLVIVNVTDGVPTLSPIIKDTSKNADGEIVTTFNPLNDTSGTAPNIKGDGQYYYLNGYYYSYHNPYSYYDYTTRNYNTVDNHGFPTLQLSQNVKNLDTEVFNIGIAVTGDTEVSSTTAKTLMANISSGAGYNYDLTNAEQLPDAFNSIINSVYRDTISKGIVTDPMGEKVDLVIGDSFDPSDYTISATRNGVNAPDLLIGVTPKYDPTTRTITLEGLNLGLGEEVIFKYKVALRVDDETVQDNVYYFTNGETTLQPNPSAGKVLWNFPVPSVKKIGEEPPQEIPKLTITNFEKPSVEFFKTTVIGTPLAGAKFQLYKKTGVEGTATRMPVGGEVTVGTDGRIYFENLDVGNYELVETQAPVGYEKLEDPAVTFEVTDKGEVTNIYGKELDASTGNNNIWNWRLPEMEVELKKLDGHLETILEGNVEFKLTKAPDNNTGGEVPSFLQTLSFADLSALQADGQTLKFNIPPEMDGEYILEETKAPDGYIRSFDKYHIMISQAERTIKLVKVTNALGMEKDYKYKAPDGKEVSVKLSEKPIILYSESSQGVKDEAVSLDFGVVNIEAVYPSTGGIGTLAFTIIGGAIMGGALIKSRRRKEEEEDRE